MAPLKTGSPRRTRRGPPPKFISARDALRIVPIAVEHGARRKSAYLTEWDAAGRCERPVKVQLSARPYRDVIDPHGFSHGIDMDVPCRKCPACLRARARLWRRRALTECKRASRTWFGTLTLSPERQHAVLCQARVHEARQGVDFDHLDEGEKFACRVAIIGREITKFLKRVREASKAELRYILVSEHHKSGDPHFHMLVHEVQVLKPVRKVLLDEQWRWGFSQWRLCDGAAAQYVTKYLTKSSETRVRASLRYGGTP